MARSQGIKQDKIECFIEYNLPVLQKIKNENYYTNCDKEDVAHNTLFISLTISVFQ